MNSNRVFACAFFLLTVTTATFAQSSRQIGAWSIYTNVAGSNNTILLQTPAIDPHGAQSGSEEATLSIICKNHKLRAIALHTSSAVNKHAVVDIQSVPTTRVISLIEGQVELSEFWGVSEKGHTFYPYSERFQGRITRRWLGRLNEGEAISFRVGGSEVPDDMHQKFDTSGLGEALASAGCTN